MKRLGFYFIAALLGAVALAGAFAAQSDGPPTVADDAAVERPDVPSGSPDLVLGQQENEDGIAEDQTEGDDQDEGDNEDADTAENDDAEREIKGIPDKSGLEAVPEDSPARTYAPPFNGELICVVTLEDGTQVAVPKNAGRNMLASGAATAGDCEGPGPGQGTGGPPETLPPDEADGEDAEDEVDSEEAEGEGSGGPPSDLGLPPRAGGPGVPGGQE